MKDTKTTALTQSASILAAVGEKGTDPKFTNVDPASLAELIGGTLRALPLDKLTAVFFDGNKQTATLLDPMNLFGTLAICGINRDGTPAALQTAKQVTKWVKLFRKGGNNAAADQNQLSLSDAERKEVK